MLSNVPYLERARKELKLSSNQKAMIVWDDFKAHWCDAVKKRATELNVVLVPVPPNFTHLLQPLDLTVNRSLKSFEQKEFSEYFTSVILKQIKTSSSDDITDITVDTKLSTMKPLHAKTLTKSYEYFHSAIGRSIIANGWRAAGITDTIRGVRDGDVECLLDPFAGLNI